MLNGRTDSVSHKIKRLGFIHGAIYLHRQLITKINVAIDIILNPAS